MLEIVKLNSLKRYIGSRYRLKAIKKHYIYANPYILLKARLSNVILCFGLASGLGFVILTIFHPKRISNTVPMNLKTVAILA